jgi:hypothetical protein
MLLGRYGYQCRKNKFLLLSTGPSAKDGLKFAVIESVLVLMVHTGHPI